MLTGKQKRFLRALGHGLKPVIQIGKKELEDGVVAETERALAYHELVKVKLLESCLMDRREAAEQLSTVCRAEIAQVLGRTFLLYRRADEPKLVLPSSQDA